jgi:hypothetical protein
MCNGLHARDTLEVTQTQLMALGNPGNEKNPRDSKGSVALPLTPEHRERKKQ